MEDVRTVLQCLWQHGTELKPPKCELFKREIRCLGLIVSAEGSKMDPADTLVVRMLKENRPRIMGGARAAMGLLRYHYHDIRQLSHIAGPLYSLLQVDPGQDK